MTQATQPSGEMTREDFEARLVQRAAEDESFRQELLRNPKTVWERESGESAPEGVEITVVEESPNHLYVVLPSFEMSDEELESVAGGGHGHHHHHCGGWWKPHRWGHGRWGGHHGGGHHGGGHWGGGGGR